MIYMVSEITLNRMDLLIEASSQEEATRLYKEGKFVELDQTPVYLATLKNEVVEPDEKTKEDWVYKKVVQNMQLSKRGLYEPS